MNKFKVFLCWLFGLLTLAGCGEPSGKGTVASYTEERDESIRGMRHIVFFDLKDSLMQSEMDAFTVECRKLKSIKAVKDFELGFFTDVEDPRAMSDFESVISMRFEEIEDYRSYQKDSIHLSVKKHLIPMLKAPPVTYDYEIID